jgi:hypothetical protein
MQVPMDGAGPVIRQQCLYHVLSKVTLKRFMRILIPVSYPRFL